MPLRSLQLLSNPKLSELAVANLLLKVGDLVSRE